jgi:hypothetical protein
MRVLFNGHAGRPSDIPESSLYKLIMRSDQPLEGSSKHIALNVW